MTSYKLGKKSLAELKGVHPDLVKVVKWAIQITDQDFSVHDGIRTTVEQAILVNKGASKTMKSKHIIGHAVDLVPYINGKLRWEWTPIYDIAKAMHSASKDLDVPLRWGGAWDVDFTAIEVDPEKMVHDYVDRQRKAGKSAFIDGPHFELLPSMYG